MSDGVVFEYVAVGRIGSAEASRLRQSEGKNIVALFRAELSVSSGGDDKVLLTIHNIRHRRGLATRGQLIFPKFFSAIDVKGPQVEIQRSGSEDQAARGYDRSTEIYGARLFARNHCAQRNIPDLLTRVDINGFGGSPGRRIAR